ncbi:transcriptional regulator [Comamonas serinivorans]|uniref:Transcriptional regulator n=1 Tax=Comamonas serinivorans TaxID=1082851 RepID=A0A1Y0ELH9_9BURK|nr:PLP-dependent aminotransferase family protein [Comamonas serinivorans]ARU04457.1 transcriptional regulator [Comamonas serinivorans]
MRSDVTPTPKYRTLATHVMQAIEQGVLRPGQRLPSVRDWAQRFGVSHNTALQAMRTLEDELWVSPRARSGFYVRARPEPARLKAPRLDVPPLEPTAVTLDWYAQRLLGSHAREGVVTFGTGTPDAQLLAPERVRTALHQAVTRNAASLTVYPHETGAPVLQHALARFALDLGCVLPPEDIVITQGCIDAIACALRVCTQPGDVVAIESPAHFSFLELLQSLGLRALEVPTHASHGMSLDALQLALDTHPIKAVLVVPTLQNPLGSCMPPSQRKRLAQMASTHDVAVIEDAVYNEWADDDAHRRTVKAHDRSGHVMLCHSFTKTLAPGLRLGWLHAGRWTDAVRTLRDKQMGAPTTVLQLALAQLIGHSHAAHMRQLRQKTSARLREARGLIARHFPKGTRLSNPSGGLLLWLQLPPDVDAERFEARCLAEGVLAPPGRFFSLTGRYEGCYRIALGAWSDAHRQGLIRMGQLAHDPA